MLWIFGDSFSVPREKINNPPNYNLWPELLSKNLNLDEYHNYAEWGVSNDYIYDQFNQKTELFKPGDFILIQLTSIDRQWFFEDNPTFGNYYAKGLEKEISKEEYSALKMYIGYLKRDKIDLLRYHMLIGCLERDLQILNFTRILILPGFTPMNNIKGTLVEISENEFKSKNDMQKFYDSNNGKDPRSNHLSRNNHLILSNKITKFFTHGHRVDLTTEFEKEFL